MQTILNKIDALQKQLQSLLPMKPEYQQRLDKKFRLEFNFNSNHLEGNTLTYGETELLLIFGQTKGNHDIREYDEMKAHNVAYEMIKEWATDKERPLTEMDIKNLNEVILVEPFWKDAITPDGQNVKRQIKIGDYKEYPNSVRLPNGEMFHYASPTETPIQMGELIQWYRTEEEKKELHPVTLAALFHYKFVRIHPFDDGNGRISRLLVNYVLLKNNLPPAIIKSADKNNYLHALHQADAGFLDEFVHYVAEQAKWSLEISIKAAKGESIDEPGDLDKKLNLLKKKLSFNEEIILEKNKNTVIAAYTINIRPLLEKVTDTLNKFDNFFMSKDFEIRIWEGGDSSYWGVKTMEGVLTYIQDHKIDSLCYQYQLTRLRKNSTVNFSINVEIYINFYELAYEISSDNLSIGINRLYHETVTQDEYSNIAESLGNKIYERVETALRAQ